MCPYAGPNWMSHRMSGNEALTQMHGFIVDRLTQFNLPLICSVNRNSLQSNPPTLYAYLIMQSTEPVSGNARCTLHEHVNEVDIHYY